MSPARNRYTVTFTETANDDLRNLSRSIRSETLSILSALAYTPRPAQAKAVPDYPDFYQISIAQWLIIYKVQDKNLSVLIFRIQPK
jgi:mRNA-degrading endonuclease RelE of RelBE toxin-antitoxin system